jgi:hypothetical protein
MQTTTARATWHPPKVRVLTDSIIGLHDICPPAAQLELSSLHPSRKRTDHAHVAEQNRDRQARWRERDIDSKSCGVVDWSGAVLTMLVETGYIEDGDTGDSRTVAKAIGEMLEEAAEAKAWKRKW